MTLAVLTEAAAFFSHRLEMEDEASTSQPMAPRDESSKAHRSNTEWILSLASRDESAIADLTTLVRRGLITGIRGKIDASLAEDIAQDALLKILENLSTFRGDCRFTSWVMAIAMRTAFSELRRARWRDVSLESLTQTGSAFEPPSRSCCPEENVAYQQLLDKMKEAIDTILSEKQKIVIKAELCGMPQAVLCDRLEINRNALYKLGHDARLKLKKHLAAQGISETDVRILLDSASDK